MRLTSTSFVLSLILALGPQSVFAQESVSVPPPPAPIATQSPSQDNNAVVPAAPDVVPTPAPAPPAPVTPPPPTLSELISGKGADSLPINLRLSDLTPAWRRFAVGTVDQGLGALGAYMAVLSGGQNLGGDYFTSGQTVMLGDTTYLVAYRLPVKKVDFSSVLGQHADFTILPDQVSPDSILTLSLLNLRTVSAIDNIQPFNMGDVIRGSNEQRGKLAQVLGERSDMEAQTNLEQLAQAVLQETTDHNGTIPAISNPMTLKRAIYDDIKSDASFLDPMTKRPFFANPFLSGHKISEFSKPSDIVLLYADAAGDDGLRAVAFLDGSVHMVDREEWQHLVSTQHLP